MEQPQESLLALTTQIVTAHVANNEIETDELPGLIQEIYRTLQSIGGEPVRVSAAQPMRPRLVADDGAEMLVCQDCGMAMKMLKRHLLTVHGLTPDEYRRRWGLPDDTPMVTASYAQLRSSLAKQSGLGKRPWSRGR